MKKINDIRHYESMILALKSRKRKAITASEIKRCEWHIENYKMLLEYVQNS